ncbi:MAG: formylglycine-generating enzyme family protein, partial [Nitrospira sp.]|nr:formylglycine-generating enzyme family protein [Nitrospira sp.]
VTIMGNNPSQFKGQTNPVENVSWEDVQEFIRELNTQEGGKLYRLPTEAEWEYAARAGSTSKYVFGDEETQLDQYAWYRYNSGGKTHPVGQLKPNTWGFYDMYGNVWEWVSDLYHKDYYAQSPDTDPQGPADSSHQKPDRVARGGGWLSDARFCRSASRGVAPGVRRGHVGFRLVRIVE